MLQGDLYLLLRKNGCDKLFKNAVDSNDEHTVAGQWRITVASSRIFTDETLEMVARRLQEKLAPLSSFLTFRRLMSTTVDVPHR